MFVYTIMRTIISLLVLAVVIAGGIWLFNRADNLAVDTNGTTNTENVTGTGGPEEGYDPLDINGDGTVDDADYDVKG